MMFDFSDFHNCWAQHVSSFDVAVFVLLGAVSLWALFSIVYSDFTRILDVRKHEALIIKLLWAVVVLLADLIGAAAYLLWRHYYARSIGAPKEEKQ